MGSRGSQLGLWVYLPCICLFSIVRGRLEIFLPVLLLLLSSSIAYVAIIMQVLAEIGLPASDLASLILGVPVLVRLPPYGSVR